MELVQVLAASGAGVTGIGFLFFGVLAPYFAKKFAPPYEPEAEAKSRAVKLQMSFFFACVATAVLVGVVMDNIGYGAVMGTGFAIMGICMLMLVSTNSFKIAKIASVAMGIGTMACSVGANTLFPVILFGGEKPEQALNLGNIFFALGCILFPLFLDKINFRNYQNIVNDEERAAVNYRDKGYKVMAVAIALIILAVLSIFPTYPTNKVGFSIDDAANLIFEVAILISAAALFCYIALEASFNQWLKTAAMDAYGNANVLRAEGFGSLAIIVFSSAMIASRYYASGMEELKASGNYYIAALGIAAAIIVGLMAKAQRKYLVMLFAALAGAAFGPCFPTIVGMTMKKFSGMGGTIFGLIFSIGLIGAFIVPNWLNKLTIKKQLTTLQVFKYLISFAIALAILAFVLGLVKGNIN